MKRVHSIKDLRDLVSAWQGDGLRVGLVPTMGALHIGHLSLVHHIARHVDRVIVSIFVNPMQFGAHEDLGAYPRTLDADCAQLADLPCDCVYAPPADEMYPAGFKTQVDVNDISVDYEGANRPGHFTGVATVVCKLLLQSRADAAIFGEKDFQQLAVIRRFVQDLDIECDILEGPLVREADGLACSSRNQYLDTRQRRIAGHFNRRLQDLVQAAADGGDLRACEQACAKALLQDGFDKVDYVTIVDPDTLEPRTGALKSDARVVAAARLGTTRLLDTMAIPVAP